MTVRHHSLDGAGDGVDFDPGTVGAVHSARNADGARNPQLACDDGRVTQQPALLGHDRPGERQNRVERRHGEASNDDVARLEYVLHASGGYEIGAIAKDGGRKIVQASDSPLKTEAQTYARVMGKELVFVDNTRGFGGN